ncbi:hypothetical protein DFH07DRAFT_939902 [Mycena maculata]|uniref:Uncharacterized protein n=1 Tax=Mycena maculata TaxID=230809 RepID=A0AAD7NH02_9AGAR|nr:hypothetical protein DFH07DRAFT_939902 [Mycena maculata]
MPTAHSVAMLGLSYNHCRLLLGLVFCGLNAIYLYWRSDTLPRSMPPVRQVYSSQLCEIHRGYALWCPEPYLYDEVKVEDVGYLGDGAFHRLFNATLPADDPGQTLQVGVGFTHRLILSGDASVHFQCWRTQEALLHFPRSAMWEEALAREAFEMYALRNFPSWYEFANAVLFRGVKNGEIIFVGCDKTSEWVSAVFDERSTDAGISLNSNAVPGASIRPHLQRRGWDQDRPNHLYFRGYKILERKIRSPKVIRATAEPRPPSPGEDQHDSCGQIGRKNGNGPSSLLETLEQEYAFYAYGDDGG